MNILVISAVEKEIGLLREKTEAFSDKEISLFQLYTSKTDSYRLNILVTGPGIVNTSSALTLMIKREKPDLIIQTGIGGAFRKSGMDLCGIAVSSSETDIQLGLESKENFVDPLPFDIFNSNSFSVKNFIDCDTVHARKAYDVLKKRFDASYGPFVTVSTITTTDDRASMIFKSYEPVIESMEGFAGAYISKLYGVEYLQIRSASNFTGNRERDKWEVDKSCVECSNAVYHYLQSLN